MVHPRLLWLFEQLTICSTTDSGSSDPDSSDERSVKRLRISPPKLTTDEEEALKKTYGQAWSQN